MTLNTIYQVDCMEGLKQLPDNSIDIIITSPPYNKYGLNHRSDRSVDYNDDKEIDNLPEDKYEEWQLEFLKECYRVLKKDGSMFYNHKNRIKLGKGEIVSPYLWLFKSPFKIRQEIVWDRRNSQDVNLCRYLPSTERVYWLTKTIRPSFKRTKETKFKGEVWQITAKPNTWHPAPFSEELVDNILQCIPNEKEDKVVLDPFMGSGTTAVSAKKYGFNYVGFELFQEYINKAKARIESND